MPRSGRALSVLSGSNRLESKTVVKMGANDVTQSIEAKERRDEHFS